MKRNLAVNERFFYYLGNLIVSHANIRGEITADLMQSALKKIQKQHPLACVTVHFNEQNLPMFITGV